MTPRVAAPWSHDEGFSPWKVTAYEEPTRKLMLYLRWRHQGNWKRVSLKRVLRDDKGRIDPAVREWAIERARQQVAALRAGPGGVLEEPAAPLTVIEAIARVTDPRVGLYPVASNHRREVVAALRAAARLWGSDTPWNAIKRSDLIALWRMRITELREKKKVGHRAAEITIARVLTVAAWLRDHELIAATACIPSKKWKTELRADWAKLTGSDREPVPDRPRHTLEEYRALLTASWDVDPRLGFLLALGAELRLGQVRRCWRRDLTLEDETGKAFAAGSAWLSEGGVTRGWLLVPTSGKKKGVRVRLTPGQLQAVLRAIGPEGFLRPLEVACRDYPLFPAGQLRGGRKGTPSTHPSRHATASHVGRRAILEWFAEAEDRCDPKIPHVPGRGPYGLRRVGVDEGKRRGISREGLKASGGWTDTQVPDRIYAEQEQEAAADEAAQFRAQIRGETE